MFDSIARLAARIAKAEAAAVELWTSSAIEIIGSDGLAWRAADPRHSFRCLSLEGGGITYVANVRRDVRTKTHPLVMRHPSLRRIIYVSVPLARAKDTIGIAIFDPDPKWTTFSSAPTLLNELGNVVRGAISEVGHPTPMSGGHDHFAESAAMPTSCPGPVAQFLLETLVNKVALHTRREFSFTTVRTWRTPLKKYQIAGLTALKASPPDEFVAAVAEELAGVMRHMVGHRVFDRVASVPCGHSKSDKCFSSLIGRAVAEILEAPYIETFNRQRREGRSHPRRNAQMEKFELISSLDGGHVLLIDDVATTGTHLLRAMSLLAPKAQSIMAIAWIGDK